MTFETVNEQSERGRLALMASWEIESAADALVDHCAGIEAEHLVVRSLSLRVRELSHVIMSALGDKMESLESIEATLLGRRLTGPA